MYNFIFVENWIEYDVINNFSVWLRTGSNQPDINRFRSDTGMGIIAEYNVRLYFKTRMIVYKCGSTKIMDGPTDKMSYRADIQCHQLTGGDSSIIYCILISRVNLHKKFQSSILIGSQ